MKKTLIFMLMLSVLAITSVFAKDKSSDKEWEEIGEQGKKLLQETGKFFAETGKKVGKEVKDSGIIDSVKEGAKSLYEDATTPQCAGKWTYKNGKSKTVIECKESGKMKVSQKCKNGSATWEGTYTATAHTITFKVDTISGYATIGTWIIAYSVPEDGKSMKVSSFHIPQDTDGSNFKTGVTFKK